MARGRQLSLLHAIMLAIFVLHCYADEKKLHIVYMGERLHGDFAAASTHISMLESVLGSTSSAKESLVYSYGKSFNGFAAKLSSQEVGKLSEMEGVISVFPNHKLMLHTTRSWDFMGFSNNKLQLPNTEGDVIIGLLDTGAWPESKSFDDDGMSAAPAKWKGKCEGANFTCNNKLIGARFYNSENEYGEGDIKSPRDSFGHGTHTASTAAGREVVGASYFGLANGTARGGASGARIAVYKVCWYYGCGSAEILAAFDDAIADGVDIISVSLGHAYALPYFEDVLAIGSFHAMRYGLLTSISAGNSGPDPYSVSNVAPWSLTVAASTIDRRFIAKAILGNGQVLTGVSINNFTLNGTTFPLIWGGDAVNYSAGANQDYARSCSIGSLDSFKVAGKIVLCEDTRGSSGVLQANGIGAILTSSYYLDVAFGGYSLPTTEISTEGGLQVLNYIRSTDNPIATILVSETETDIMAPFVVSFSSRGPNSAASDILKPDITAPGVDILAAWSPASFTGVDYYIVSGTSMSCPHASGAAAFVKSVHPNWSPAAIKSALMTTADIMDTKKNQDLEFAYGSGHINPLKAKDPGLVYDTTEADYVNFLCKQGYNTTTLRLITGTNSSYCNSTQPGRGWDLNYPTFALAVEDGKPASGVFTRTVTNVGLPDSTYTLETSIPSTISVLVEPTVLSFSSLLEKKTFTVTVDGPPMTNKPIMSGAIKWKSGSYSVRSPLVVYNVLPGATNASNFVSEATSLFKTSLVSHKYGNMPGHN